MGNLSDAKVLALRFSGKPAKVYDGGGLYVEVRQTCKAFKFEYSIGGKRSRITYGKYPSVALSEARRQHELTKGLVERGIDPQDSKRRESERLASRKTLEEVAEKFLATKTEWKPSHRRGVVLRLEKDVFPSMGDRPIDEITESDLLQCLETVQDRGAVDSAHKTKDTLGQIFRYAVARHLVSHNPIPNLRGLLRAKPDNHYPAIRNRKRLGEVLRSIDSYRANEVVGVALQLLPHVFLRNSELRCARWEEIDFDRQVWTIPASRMKVPKNGDHQVPLSTQVTKIFDRILPLTGGYEFIFTTGIRRHGKIFPLSDGTLNRALKLCGVPGTEHKVHSFRHTASTLLNEMHYNRDHVELQLHHIQQGVRGDYNSAEYWSARVQMMQDWSDYLDELKLSGQYENG